MPEFSNIAIFWLAFTSFVGPVFFIALICSIVKAIRTRRAIISRMKQARTASTVDSEIITERKAQHKLKIVFIEDEAKKKKFRGAKGSLLYVSNSSNLRALAAKRFKKSDTAVDGPVQPDIPKKKRKGDTTCNSNASNVYESGEIVVEASINSTGGSELPQNTTDSSLANRNRSNNTHSSSNSNNNNYYDNVNGVVEGRKNTGNGRRNGRQRSKGSETVLPPDVPNCNGHIPEDFYHGYAKGANGKRRTDNRNPGLKPDSHTKGSRRHSINSTSSTLDRILEVKCVEVEMSAGRSKSEDNLIDYRYSPSPAYLTPGVNDGSDNRGFARSTETTFM